MLELMVPLLPLKSVGPNLDLGTMNQTIQLTGVVTGHDTGEFRDRLLPLAFGAAWKVLDLSFELAMATVGLSPANGMRWRIDEKKEHALSHAGALPGGPPPDEIWTALTDLYANTVETRHALVHRRVHVDPSTRELIGFAEGGTALPPVTYDEQLAFCRLSQRLRAGVVAGAFRPREVTDLAGQLDALKRHHGSTTLPSAGQLPPVRLVGKFPDDGRIDVPRLLALAKKNFPGVTYVDLELTLTDGRILAGELDTAPRSVLIIDPGSPPSWFKFS